MRKLLSVLLFVLASSWALGQTFDANGRQKVNVETGTVTANAGTGTMAVSGPLTDTQLRATAVPISGTFWQATQPVSGTVTANAGTGTFVVGDGAGALNVILDSGTLTSITNTVTVSGTVTANAGTGTMAISAASLPLPTGAATSALQDGIIKDGTGDTTQANVVTGRLSVDGSGVTQPVSGTVTVGTFPDNEPFNLAQVAGATVATGNGTAAGTLRVSIASDGTGQLSTVTTVGTVTNLTNLPNEGQQTAANSISVAPDTDNDPIGAAGAAPPGEYVAVAGIGSGATGGFLYQPTVCDTFVNVTVNTATTTLLITGVSGRHARICSLSLVTAAANNVALISGTGATCGTGTTGMTGGTTAATGYNFAANGGLTQGGGIGVINQTNATGDSVCVVTSAATQLSGRISYAIW